MGKVCRKCGENKDESEFYGIHEKGHQPRLQSHCKACHKRPTTERVPLPHAEGKVCRHCQTYKLFAEFHVHRRCLYGYDAVCKACRMEKHRTFAARYPERIRNTDLKAKYKITSAQWDEMFAAQDGKCKICGVADVKLAVDHNHATKKVRGLLCTLCNTMIGYSRDSIDILVSGAAYLFAEQHPDSEDVQAKVSFTTRI